MSNELLLIIILILIVTLLLYKKYCNISEKKGEGFRLFYESSPSTRNMSYDLRCEPIIPKRNYGIMDSSIEPLYREKCLDIVNNYY